MEMIIEKHTFAPELNKILFVKHGVVVATKKSPGVTSIRQARDIYFSKVQPGRVATVSTVYPKPFEHLNRTQRGRVSSFSEVSRFLENRREYAAGGPLLDGTMLPPGKVSAKTKMIG